MTTITDFEKTDLVDDHLAADYNRLLRGAFLASTRNVETLTAKKELADSDCPVQVLTASGANRDCELPLAATTNHLHFIYNAGGSNNIPVKDSTGATTYATLAPGEWILAMPSGSGWYFTGSLSSIASASESAKGIVELATAAEATTGTDNTRALSPAGIMGSIFANKTLCQGRLTLTSGTPVTITDVTAAATIYFAPYKGDLIALYSGSAWKLYEFTERSLSLSGFTSGNCYDIFIYDNSGTLTLEATAWTNSTTRATALTTQNGVLVKSGSTTRRYLGTIYMTATGQTEDSESKRFVYNYYNQVMRYLPCADTTDTWSYTTASWREANGGSTYGTSRVGLVVGWSEQPIRAIARGTYRNGTGGNGGSAGVGVDSTSTNSAQLFYGNAIGTSTPTPVIAQYDGVLSVGQHVISWLEIGSAGGTFVGDNGDSYHRSGMLVECMM